MFTCFFFLLRNELFNIKVWLEIRETMMKCLYLDDFSSYGGADPSLKRTLTSHHGGIFTR